MLQGRSPLAAAFVTLALAGASMACTARTDGGDDGAAAAIVAPPSGDLQGAETTIEGYYRNDGATDDVITGVFVRREGEKLSLHIDSSGEIFPFDLTRHESGFYRFDSGPLPGSCNEPGCSYVSRVSGAVYVETVGVLQRHRVKVNTFETFPRPEFEGDVQGEFPTSTRWSKM